MIRYEHQKETIMADNNAKRPVGRPTDYTPELGDYICELVATHSLGLPQLCEKYKDVLPCEFSVRKWRSKFPEFSAKYAQAKLTQADVLAEECLEIADDSSRDEFDEGSIARARLKIDTRKWLASKLLPKQYGDRYIMEQKEEENQQMREELRILRASLDAKNRKDY
jgi:hypothetical protein